MYIELEVHNHIIVRNSPNMQDQIYIKSRHVLIPWKVLFSTEYWHFLLCVKYNLNYFYFLWGGGSLFLFDFVDVKLGLTKLFNQWLCCWRWGSWLVFLFYYFFKFVIFVNSLRNHIVQLILNFDWSVLFDCCSISLHGCILLSIE